MGVNCNVTHRHDLVDDKGVVGSNHWLARPALRASSTDPAKASDYTNQYTSKCALAIGSDIDQHISHGSEVASLPASLTMQQPPLKWKGLRDSPDDAVQTPEVCCSVELVSSDMPGETSCLS